MDGFRIKRGADEGADHRLARLLNPNRLAGASTRTVTTPGVIGHGVAEVLSAVRLHFFVHMIWYRTRKPGPFSQN